MTRYAKSLIFLSFCSEKDKTLVTRVLICSWKQHDFNKYAEQQSAEIALPCSSGNYLDLISFFNRFKEAVIDNDQLTNSLRLH